jgi:ATP-binding cassette subfamily B protein
MLQRGAASMARINEIFKIEPSIASPKIAEQDADSAGARTDAAGVPAISVKNLTFVYPQTADEPVLENISVDIADGMFVGILGKTGSGKTTLLKTFMRLIDPPDGSVTVYGKDVRRYNLEELRSLFAVVPQDTFLFSDSVQENIAYGTEGASDDDLSNAIEIAALAKDMEEFPNGAETVIGERGVTLSGGQKQRTAIARALMRKSAKILVFDDALSAVDAETEKKFLTRFLEERAANNLPRTAVIVSHRVSTLQHTDFVLVLDGGKIIESGAPRSLMESGGFFAKTAHLQRLAESPHG